jgi:ribonuclease D
MHIEPSTPPIWVATPAALKTMLADLRAQPLVAVDTESNSLYAYREQVCLIQFSTPERDYLLDPLALDDLAALGEIFVSRKIEKIFHAAEYDIICLKRDYRFSFNAIFDTMHASRILGKSEVGLAGILASEFGITIEKRFQRANWGERPIPPAMLAYARIDTHYLIDLRNRLREELIQKGLLELAEEDFTRLTQVSASEGENDSQSCWRMIGRNSLAHEQCAVLQALIEYRDAQARKANLPHFKILSNQALIEIAQVCPTTPADLSKIAHLPPRQRERHASGLLQAVSRGLTSRPPAKPVNHRPDDAVLARLDRLKEWRKVTARSLKVESDVVLPKDIAEQIAFANPKTLDELKTIMKTTPWRFRQYGQQILKTLETH